MAKLTIGDRTVTVDDSFRSMSPEQQQAAVEEIAATIGVTARKEPSPQEMVGFGERSQRETIEPESPDLASERRIAQRMARDRPSMGADDLYLQNYTFGLRDEVAGAGAGVAGMLHGRDFNEGYEESQIADQRLREEYAAANPGKAAAANIGGLVTGGMGKAGQKLIGAALPTATKGLGTQMIEGGAVAGTQGLVYGAAEGDETGGRLKGAIADGLIGAATGGLAPAVIAGAKAIAKPITNTVRAAINPEKEAAKRVAEARLRDTARGDGMDDAAYAAAQRDGQPVTLMDRGGETTRSLARSAANQSPEGRAAMDEVIKPRFAQQVERIDDKLSSESRLALHPDDFIEAANEAARKANRPAYAKAYALGNGNVFDDTLKELMSAPAMRDAVKAAAAKAENASVVDGFKASNAVNLRFWDLTKRELDRMGRMAARNSDSDARTYQVLAKKLTSHLDSLGAMGQAYADARSTAAAFFGMDNAFDAGKAFAKPKGGGMSARDAIKGLQKMSPEERIIFKEGYIAAKRAELGEMKTNRDATLSVLNSAGERERAAVALGTKGATRLNAQIEVEATMDAVRKSMGNSTTARQLTELGLASAAGSGAMAGSGNTDIGSLTAGGLAGVATRYGKGKIDARLSQQIGKLLASSDPKKIDTLIQMASKSPKYLEVVRAIRANLIGAGTLATTEVAAQ